MRPGLETMDLRPLEPAPPDGDVTGDVLAGLLPDPDERVAA
jgi:hypothetical protein